MRFWITPLLALGLASPAHAEWYKASSDHFVVYADDSEKDVRRFAEMLESYHEAIAFVIQRKVETPSPSNRVTIFAVGSVRELKALAGGDNRLIAGFYVPDRRSDGKGKSVSVSVDAGGGHSINKKK